jgi:hypothetical protein
VAQCEFSYKKDADDTVRCRLMNGNGDCCGNVKFCRITRHWENTDVYKACPVRKRGIELEREKENGKQV